MFVSKNRYILASTINKMEQCPELEICDAKAPNILDGIQSVINYYLSTLSRCLTVYEAGLQAYSEKIIFGGLDILVYKRGQ